MDPDYGRVDLSSYELAAYEAIFKAVHVSVPPSWELEETLSSLRSRLHISNDVHLATHSRIANDVEFTALRNEYQGLPPQASNQMHDLSKQTMPYGPSTSPLQLHTSARNASNAQHFRQELWQGGGHPLGPGSRRPPRIGGASLETMLSAGLPIMAPKPDMLTLKSTDLSAHVLVRQNLIDRESPARVQPAASESPKARKVKISKQQQKSMMARAVPPGLDILKSNLVGLVLEKRETEADPWSRGIIAHTKHMTSGQQCQIVFDLDGNNPVWEVDVFLRKNQAGLTWRFVQPLEQIERDWTLIRPPHALPTLKSFSKKRKSGGTGYTPPASQPVLEDSPPYRAGVLAEALASGSLNQLHRMVRGIQAKRTKVVHELAELILEDNLPDTPGPEAMTTQLQEELVLCRSKQDSIRRELQGLVMV